jgi:hypothetical protein
MKSNGCVLNASARWHALGLVLAGVVLAAAPAAAAPAKRKPVAGPKTPEQKEADRHFKAGVELFKEGKYGEALAEFQRAYDIAPNPVVLYNIAGCYRELSQYGDAVATYNKFLADGKGKVPAARLAAAQSELDGILARIARVNVNITPALDGTTLSVDGTALDKLDMPLILPPGEHRLVAHAEGRRDAEKTIRVASGDALDVELALAELPPAPPPQMVTTVIERPAPAPPPPPERRRFTIGAGFANDLRNVRNTGALDLSAGVMLGSRVELGVDFTLPAIAGIPSLRLTLLGGSKVSLHVIAAAPIVYSKGTDGEASSTFIAGAGGLGLRYRPTPIFAVRLESMVSYAGKTHGTSVPTFLGGELWF